MPLPTTMPTIARAETRSRAISPVDLLGGMALLAGAALSILPMMAALTLFALIAAITGKRG